MLKKGNFPYFLVVWDLEDVGGEGVSQIGLGGP